MSENPEVERLLRNPDWQEERRRLRAILLDSGLDESVKWGKLCYASGGGNVAIIQGMKDCCALGFFKGALLDDREGVLVAPGEHSQAMRQLRFRSPGEITDREGTIREFVGKAIRAEEDGLQVAFAARHDLTYPEELRAALDGDPALAEAFGRLTPGRQRGYVLHLAGARQPETRRRRIEKVRPRILAGKGVNER